MSSADENPDVVDSESEESHNDTNSDNDSATGTSTVFDDSSSLVTPSESKPSTSNSNSKDVIVKDNVVDEHVDNGEGECDDHDDEDRSAKKDKTLTPGVIYLSSIPDGMQYNDVYKFFSELGDVGRISLQIGGPQPHSKRRKNYKEGWIEFLDKKKAKRCVKLLNSKQVGGRRRSRWYDSMWHMKYLPKFQWSHLTERLAYEQATMQQRMRTEIAQARREAQHFADQLDWKNKETRISKKSNDWKSNKRKYEFTQRLTDDEIRKRKVGSERVQKLEKSRTNVLGSLFGKPK